MIDDIWACVDGERKERKKEKSLNATGGQGKDCGVCVSVLHT